MENISNPLTDWIGRSETVEDAAYPTPAIALSATLEHPRAPLAEGTSCCATTASNASESCWRIRGWLLAGNESSIHEPA